VSISKVFESGWVTKACMEGLEGQKQHVVPEAEPTTRIQDVETGHGDVRPAHESKCVGFSDSDGLGNNWVVCGMDGCWFRFVRRMTARLLCVAQRSIYIVWVEKRKNTPRLNVEFFLNCGLSASLASASPPPTPTCATALHRHHRQRGKRRTCRYKCRSCTCQHGTSGLHLHMSGQQFCL
jgi:hypothetical protein